MTGRPLIFCAALVARALAGSIILAFFHLIRELPRRVLRRARRVRPAGFSRFD